MILNSMEILYKKKLSETIKEMVMDGGVLSLVSPYISDFKPWGNSKGTKIKNKKKYLTELFIKNTLECDARLLIITDKKSKDRLYSKGILKEILNRRDSFWIYLFELDKLHAKLFFNSYEAIIGSANLTYPALKHNVELGVYVSRKDGNAMVQLSKFIGELVINSKPLNKPAKVLKAALKKNNLLKNEILFNVIELLAHSSYLYRTTKIDCIWFPFKEPPVLEKLGKILDKFDDERKREDKTLPKVYHPNSDFDSFEPISKKYYKEDLKIRAKRIRDVIKLWEKYFAGKILKPMIIRKHFVNYKNPIKLPKQKLTKKKARELWDKLDKRYKNDPVIIKLSKKKNFTMCDIISESIEQAVKDKK